MKKKSKLVRRGGAARYDETGQVISNFWHFLEIILPALRSLIFTSASDGTPHDSLGFNVRIVE